MKTIGIIAAMSQESNALLRIIQESKRSPLGSFCCQRFRLVEWDCWLVTSGMGIKRAAEAARTLVEMANPQLLVSFGVAGAVNADLGIGDVVACRNTCLLEKGLPGPFQPLALLSDAARQAAVQALRVRGVRLLDGIAVTTRGSQFIQHQPEAMINPVLEMETIGIAKVAAEQGIPLLALRAISDGPQAPIPFDLEAVTDEEYNLRVGGIIKMMLKHPQLIVQFLRMGRYTRRAAENAAVALIAALSQPQLVMTQTN
jgi:nucleoside phosphorylase